MRTLARVAVPLAVVLALLGWGAHSLLNLTREDLVRARRRGPDPARRRRRPRGATASNPQGRSASARPSTRSSATSTSSARPRAARPARPSPGRAGCPRGSAASRPRERGPGARRRRLLRGASAGARCGSASSRCATAAALLGRDRPRRGHEPRRPPRPARCGGSPSRCSRSSRSSRSRRPRYLCSASVALLDATSSAACSSSAASACAARPMRGPFQPLLADVRRMASELAIEESRASGGPWSAERLHAHARASRCGGEGVVVVANREPYLHERAAGRRREGGAAGERARHRARAGDARLLRHLDRARQRQRGSRDGGPPRPRARAAGRRTRTRSGACGSREEEERATTTASRTRGCGRSATSRTCGPTFRGDDWRQYQAVNERFAEAVARGGRRAATRSSSCRTTTSRSRRALHPRAAAARHRHHLLAHPVAERGALRRSARSRSELLDGLLGASIARLPHAAPLQQLPRVGGAVPRGAHRPRAAGGRARRPRDARPQPTRSPIEWPSALARAASPPVDGVPPLGAARELGPRPRTRCSASASTGSTTRRGSRSGSLAVERLLERFPHLRGRFTFVQLAAPSRTAHRALPRARTRASRRSPRASTRASAPGAYRPIVLLRAHHEPPRPCSGSCAPPTSAT